MLLDGGLYTFVVHLNVICVRRRERYGWQHTYSLDNCISYSIV